MSLQNRWYQVSKCSFLMVLWLAFPVLRATPALADVPPPNTDCTGATVTPEEYLELVARMGAVAAGYESVFTSYAWCDELPLYIAGVPETCMPSEGWRNFWGDAEGFTLEPLYVHTLDVDDVLAYAPLDPESEAILRAHQFRSGVLGGVVSTACGDVGLYGTLLSLSDDEGAIWSYWSVVGVISAEDVAASRSALSCGEHGVYYNPAYKSCFDGYNGCIGPATDDYNQAMNDARSVLRSCLAGSTLVDIGALVCAASLAGTGPLALIPCGITALGGLVASVHCSNVNNAARNSANRQYERDKKDCKDKFNACKASIAAGGSDTSAPPSHAER
jgi:hypothetical protein